MIINFCDNSQTNRFMKEQFAFIFIMKIKTKYCLLKKEKRIETKDLNGRE